jgi:MFS family permease
MFRPSYKLYALSVLTLVHTLNLLDRGLMGLLLQSIKVDLQLSDSQLGFVTGIAFALFYATVGLPMARCADRGNRATLASIAIGLWGTTVMLCLAVANFSQLVFARIAAAIGEAGCMPPTYSLVGDYFPGAAERIRALAVYTSAGALASLLSMLVGGWLNEIHGWRVTFFIAGIPGLILAIVVKLTIVEPRVGSLHTGSMPSAPPIGEVLKLLWRQGSSRHLIVALVLLFTLGSGLAPWYATFMIRSHGMGTAELGLWMGLIFCLGSISGVLLGGYVTGRWFAHDERSQMRLCAVMMAVVLPGFVSFLLLPEKHQALLALIPLVVVSGFFAGPTYALLQRLVPASMRATAFAIVMLLANLIGMGIGPQVVGILSDWLTPSMGSDSLRYAMLGMSLLSLWTAYHFGRAGRTVKEDLADMAASGRQSAAPALS